VVSEGTTVPAPCSLETINMGERQSWNRTYVQVTCVKGGTGGVHEGAGLGEAHL
jgi:hypothetical protein